MERSADELGEILHGLTIHPPKLEDAGLEDCALPPESIMEAFSRAANSLKSRIIIPRSEDGDDGDCVQDPGPTNGQIPDTLVGAGLGAVGIKAPSCGGNVTAGKGEGFEGDKVAVIGGGDWEAASASDRVLVLGGDEKRGEKGCCPSLEEGGVVGEKKEVDVDVERDDDKKPLLVEALI